MQPGYGQPATGERWNVNMPAVIGVVFVFLLAVVIWVIATSGGDGDGAAGDAPIETPPATESPATTVAAVSTTESATGTTTPAPMPATTMPIQTTAPTSAPSTAPPTTEPPPATAAPATTAPGADPDTVPGDLGVPGRAMQRPACDGSFITVLASPIGGQATAASLAAVLDTYPGSNYLRTDETCPSLTPSSGGEPIYVVFLGPFSIDSDACAARSNGPDGSYARQLSDDLSPDHVVTCT